MKKSNNTTLAWFATTAEHSPDMVIHQAKTNKGVYALVEFVEQVATVNGKACFEYFVLFHRKFGKGVELMLECKDKLEWVSYHDHLVLNLK